ncbi:N/A [soil metagenome]
MKRILVLFSTYNGQTEKIALNIRERLIAIGFDVEISNLKAASGHSFDDFDGIIAGAAVHFSKFEKHFRAVVSQNAFVLSKTPTAFFSVCLGILETKPETQLAERKIVTDFFEETMWQPNQWAIFAGALTYTQYGWLKKHVMRVIALRAGNKTDPRYDYEFTNWKEVELFADRFAVLVNAADQVNFSKSNPDRKSQVTSHQI